MGLNVVVERVAGELGVEAWVANELCFNSDCFTGEVRIHVGWGEKGRVAQRFMLERGISPERAVAVGDSESDLSMFEVVGNSIAVNPRDEQTALAADAVVRGSLTQLLPLILDR
jgi:phosphoserine phosphatase